MRIVSRTDFDGVVCAALLYEVENITEPTKWAQPDDIQNGRFHAKKNDIITNLPYHQNCALWFDHHLTNKIDIPFNGIHKTTPSAARIIFDYYKSRFKTDYSELVQQTDRIDSADISAQEAAYPEKYPYMLLSMTVSEKNEPSEELFWNRLVQLLRKFSVSEIIKHPEVQERCEKVRSENQELKKLLKQHTHTIEHVTVTDFRSLKKPPGGNRFLVYSMFPHTSVNLRIRFSDRDSDIIMLGAGHNIFNKTCKVNIGIMLSQFGGGGHRGAGGCSFKKNKANDYIPQIIDILLKNKNNEGN